MTIRETELASIDERLRAVGKSMVSITFYCTKCRKEVKELTLATKYSLKRGLILSAVKRHYAKYHPKR